MVVGRFVASLVWLLASFVGGFVLAGLVVKLLTGNPVRAASIGAVRGFAAAFVLNVILIGARQTHERDG